MGPGWFLFLSLKLNYLILNEVLSNVNLINLHILEGILLL